MRINILCLALGIWCPAIEPIGPVLVVSPSVVAELAMDAILPVGRPFVIRVPCSNGDSSERINHAIIFAAKLEEGYRKYIQSLGMLRRWRFPVSFGTCTYTITKSIKLIGKNLSIEGVSIDATKISKEEAVLMLPKDDLK